MQNRCRVFALVDVGDYKNDIKNYVIGENKYTTAARIDRDKISNGQWFTTYIVRILIRLMASIGINLKDSIDKKAIRKIEKKYHFDYVVAFSEGEPTRFVSHFSSKHKIAWIHCDYSRCLKDAESEFKLFSEYEQIVCVSKFTQQSFSGIFPRLSDRTTYIYNLLDAENIQKLSREKIDNVSFSNEQFTIISVGRICEVKRYDRIPQIAKTLRDRGLQFRWYIIGPAAEPHAYQTLTRNINEYEVSDIVKLLGPIKNPYPYFVQSDLLVSLSWSEACPMIFNEAKVLKIPVVSADFGSSYEFISENTDGMIRRIEEIPDAIQTLMEDQKQYQHLASTIRFTGYNEVILEQLNNLFI